MHVSRYHNILDTPLADRLWAVYELAYQGMSHAAVTREMLYRDEFDGALADDSNRMWVLWQQSLPVAMLLIATDIDTTRYLSRAYFEEHFAEHARRDSIHYVMWLVVDPEHEARGAALRLGRAAAALASAEGSLVVFDSPDVNQPTNVGGFAEMAKRLVHHVPAASLHNLGTQRYFAVDFAPADLQVDSPAAAPHEPRAVVPSRAGRQRGHLAGRRGGHASGRRHGRETTAVSAAERPTTQPMTPAAVA